jgi:hypothetical protein
MLWIMFKAKACVSLSRLAYNAEQASVDKVAGQEKPVLLCCAVLCCAVLPCCRVFPAGQVAA